MLSLERRSFPRAAVAIAGLLLGLAACQSASPPRQNRTQAGKQPRAEQADPSRPRRRAPSESGPADARAEVARVTSFAVLNLDAALVWSETHHPELAALSAEIDAAEGQVFQAGRLPNPSLVARVEQVPTRKSPNRFIQPILGIEQVLPIGGRLGKAEELAQRQLERRQAERRARRHALRRKIRGAFATALYVEKVAALTGRNARAARSLVALAKARERAGEQTERAVLEAELKALAADSEARRIAALRTRARLALAAAMGQPKLDPGRLTGRLEASLELSRLQRLIAKLDELPELAAADAEVEESRARIALIEAERVPDITLDLLYRRLEDDRVDSFDIGVQVPLAIFDRQRGDLRTARAKLRASEARRRVVRASLEQRLREARSQVSEALTRARLLRDEVLPRSERLRDAVRARFNAGDVPMTDLLQSQTAHARFELEYLAALRDVVLGWSELSALTGET